jgi:hypothetical protein
MIISDQVFFFLKKDHNNLEKKPLEVHNWIKKEIKKLKTSQL